MIGDDLRKAIDAIERLDPKWTLPSNIHSCSEGAITFTKGTDDGCDYRHDTGMDGWGDRKSVV